jgi:hypothetical protein
MNHTPRALRRARTWTAGALTAAALATGGVSSGTSALSSTQGS